MKKRNRMVVLFGLLLGICLSGLSVFAEGGTLSIDNSVINQQGKNPANGAGSTLYQVAPDLFLADKSQKEKELSTVVEQQLTRAKSQGFTKTDATDPYQTDQLLAGLFVTDQIQSEHPIEAPRTHTQEQMPRLVFWSMAAVVLTLAGTGGVLLGRKYARIFRKREKKR